MFVIIGIVILLLIVLVFYARNISLPVTKENLADELDAINEHITNCLELISEEPIIRIAEQGGYLNPSKDTFRLYNDTRVSYLCYNIPNSETCQNRLLLKTGMEQDLSNNINSLLLTCLNIESFNSNILQISSSPWQASVLINKNNINVNLDYPVNIKSLRSGTEIKNQEVYSIAFNYPLGDLYQVSQDIINEEAANGDFDQLPYMLLNKNYKIIKLRPYPDKLYIIQRIDNNYRFQFFIQGE